MWQNFRKINWDYSNLEKKKTTVPILTLQVDVKQNVVNKISSC